MEYFFSKYLILHEILAFILEKLEPVCRLSNIILPEQLNYIKWQPTLQTTWNSFTCVSFLAAIVVNETKVKSP